MATTKLTYNDIALRLNRLEEEINNYNAPLDVSGQENDAKLQEMLLQKHLLENQLKKAVPATKYTPEQVAGAVNSIAGLKDKIVTLQKKGVSNSDPRIAQLTEKLKQAQQMYKDYTNDPNRPDRVKKQTDAYIAEQNAQLKTKTAANEETAKEQAQLSELEKQRDNAAALGEDTSKLDLQIAALQKQTSTSTAGTVAGPKATVKTGADAIIAQAQAAAAKTSTTTSTTTTGDNTTAGSTGGQTTTKSKTPSAPLDKNAQLQTLAQQYGAIGAMAMSPENSWIGQILTEAANAKGGAWTKQKFIDTVQKDPRWAAMGQAMQKAQEDFYGSGGAAWYTSYDRLWNMMYNNAIQQGLDPSALGPELKATDTAGISAAFKDPNNPVTAYLNMHYSDPSALNDSVALGHYVATHAKIAYNPASGTPQGDIANNSLQLRTLANDWGMSGLYTDAQLQDYAQKMEQGLQGYDLNSFTAANKAHAINMYKPFADTLQNGSQTLAQLAQPYISTLSGLLEIDPSNVDLGATSGYGNIISKAMMGDGTKAVDPLTFANTVRSLPEWLNTQNAQKSLLSAGDQLIAKMGLG